MSTEGNKAIKSRLYEEFNKQSLAVVDELIDTNWVGHGPGEQEMKGPESLKQFTAMMWAAFPNQHMTIEDQIAEGDKVVTRLIVRGTHQGDFMGIAPTGKQFTITGIVISRIIDGKIVECWQLFDLLGQLQQLGGYTFYGGWGWVTTYGISSG